MGVRSLAIILLISCWSGYECLSFSLRVTRRAQHSKALQRCVQPIVSPLQLNSYRYDVDEKQKEEALSLTTPAEGKTRMQRNGSANMKFVGTKTVSTAPVPFPEGGLQELNEFFAIDRHRNLLFFRNDVSIVRNPSEELIRRWSEEAKLGGGRDIMEGGEYYGRENNILRMKAYLNMPGMRVLSETLVGAKLVLTPRTTRKGCSDVAYPEYQFTVIDTKLKPEGAAPLVWVFNKLVKYMDKTSSFTRVRAKHVDGVDCNKIVFTTDARLETRIHLPYSMAKVLPVNSTKFEQQGSRSMQRLLEKELEPALACFCDAYRKWISA